VGIKDAKIEMEKVTTEETTATTNANVEDTEVAAPAMKNVTTEEIPVENVASAEGGLTIKKVTVTTETVMVPAKVKSTEETVPATEKVVSTEETVPATEKLASTDEVASTEKSKPPKELIPLLEFDASVSRGFEVVQGENGPETVPVTEYKIIAKAANIKEFTPEGRVDEKKATIADIAKAEGNVRNVVMTFKRY